MGCVGLQHESAVCVIKIESGPYTEMPVLVGGSLDAHSQTGMRCWRPHFGSLTLAAATPTSTSTLPWARCEPS
jgi:hypothetical protein